ncbi:hypothetical protein IKS73_06825 [bacterium]|nr:hypothetical protein [bacterium]
MKKYLTMVILFCFCFSLVAAEGKVEQEKEKQSSWTTENLFYGPKLLVFSPLLAIPFMLRYAFIGPLVVPFVAIDGAIHTATFGLFARPENDPLNDLLILRLLFNSPSEEEKFEKGVEKYQKKAEKGNARAMGNLSDVYYEYYKTKWNKTYALRRVGKDWQKYEQEKQEYLKIKGETLNWLAKAVKAGDEIIINRDDFIKLHKDRYDLIMSIPDPWDAKDEETPFMNFTIDENGFSYWSPK